MTQTPISRERQATAVQAIQDHHGRLARTIADHTLTIRHAVDGLSAVSPAQDRLIAFCTEQVLPHAVAEEDTLYRAAADLPHARLLVQAMLREHDVLRTLVDTLASARTGGQVTAAAAALDAVFRTHLEKENDLLLPALIDAGIDLDALLAGTHDILDDHGPESRCGHTCACGGQDEHDGQDAVVDVIDGELDVRSISHAQRHAQIFATFDALAPGAAFDLVNDHDPEPLRYQFAAQRPGEFTWDRLETGPQVWRIRLGRA